MFWGLGLARWDQGRPARGRSRRPLRRAPRFSVAPPREVPGARAGYTRGVVGSVRMARAASTESTIGAGEPRCCPPASKTSLHLRGCSDYCDPSPLQLMLPAASNSRIRDNQKPRGSVGYFLHQHLQAGADLDLVTVCFTGFAYARAQSVDRGCGLVCSGHLPATSGQRSPAQPAVRVAESFRSGSSHLGLRTRHVARYSRARR